MRLQISSGNGPEECELAVGKFLESIKKEIKDLYIIESKKGINKNTYKYVIVENSDDLSFLEGSIKWICQSPYRENCRRKNWFIDVSVISYIEKYSINESLIRFETFRCSGNGGQNINKVETGVRAVYDPLDLRVEVTEERTQKMNKDIAVRKLREKIEDLNMKALKDNNFERWSENKSIERGNEIRVYKGMSFKRIK